MKILSCFLVMAFAVASNCSLLADSTTPAAPAAPAAPAGPKPALYELAKIKGADVEIKEDAQALGGEYVMNKQPYNPVLFMPTPAGAQLTVWARIRGSSFQIKGVVGGNQQALDWVWGTPGQFVWKKFGTYTHVQLGDQIVVIRGDKADPTDGIDCILVAPDGAYDPSADQNVKQYLAN